MAPININLQELIRQLVDDTPSANELERVTEAQRRAQTLTDSGDQLVGHFVSAAREAGSSWAQIGDAIGVSKQAAQQRDSLRLYQRFTDRARQALVRAQECARDNHGAHITSEHLLYGVLAIEEGLAVKAVSELSGGALNTIREELTVILPRDAENPPVRLVYAEMGRRVIDETTKVAVRLNHNFVGTEHLLLGILAAGGPAVDLLARHGVTAEKVESAVLSALEAIIAARQADQQ